ncbi:hypothetical protein QYM36_003171 [Artemia franciscana]|uniref:GLTSCR protein conserved domain-containing protein n=1 Tax=Artemia franciscana TaxID=6661 RepID=A0AA88IAA1_ARTSF|nr:hypothetical protein QYM36_003171 [Artemia franciscana]KAK2722886.1 hypothetical protein QYM36_003171 [Artemia franciscana]
MDGDRDIFSELNDLENILGPGSSGSSHHTMTVSPMEVQSVALPNPSAVHSQNGIMYQQMHAPSPIHTNIVSPVNRPSPSLTPGNPASIKSPSSAMSPQYRYLPSPGRPPSNPGLTQQTMQMQQIVSGGQVVQLMPNTHAKSSSKITKQILPKPIQAKSSQTIQINKNVKPVQSHSPNLQQNQIVINQQSSGAVLVNQLLQPLNNNGYILQQQPNGGLQLIMRQPTAPAGPGPPRGNQPTIILQSQNNIVSGAQQVMRVLGHPSLGGMQLQQVQTPNGPAFIALQSGQVLQNGAQILQQVAQVMQNPVIQETKSPNEQSFSPPRSVKKIAKKPSETKKSIDLSMLLKDAGIVGDEDLFSMEESSNLSAPDPVKEEVRTPTPQISIESPRNETIPTTISPHVKPSVPVTTPVSYAQHIQNTKNASVTNSHLLEALQGSKVPRSLSQPSPKFKPRLGSKVIVPKRETDSVNNHEKNIRDIGADTAKLIQRNVPNGQSPLPPSAPPPQVKTIQLSLQNQQLLKKLQAQVQLLTSKSDRTNEETLLLQRMLQQQQKIIAMGTPVSSSQPTSPASTPASSPVSNGHSSSVITRTNPQSSSDQQAPPPPRLQSVVKPRVESPSMPQPGPSLSHTGLSPTPAIPLTVTALEDKKVHIPQISRSIPPPAALVKEEAPAPHLTRKRPLSKTTLFEHQLKVDQNGALNPDYRVPFLNKSNACKRLLRYHVYYERPPNPFVEEQEESEFQEEAEHVASRFQSMLDKYRTLLFRESMRDCPSSEHVMIQRRFVAEERFSLERLREEARLNISQNPFCRPEPLVKTEPNRTGSDSQQSIKVEPGNITDSATQFKCETRVKCEPLIKRTEPPLFQEARVVLERLKENRIKCEQAEYNELERLQKDMELYPHSDLYKSGKDPLEEDINAQVQSAIDSILNLQKVLEEGGDMEKTIGEAARGIFT